MACLGHQHCGRYIILRHQYGRRYVVLGHQHGHRYSGHTPRASGAP